ncbi:MAG: thiamine ABC transporter substrate-binding protein [Thermoplasmata archaeon]
MIPDPENLPTPRRRRLIRPGRSSRILIAIAIVVVVVLAGYGLAEYELLNPPNGEPTLTIYTYPSLLGGVDCSSPVAPAVFGAFESAHHVRLVVECPPGTLYSTLVEQKNAPGADLVIGLDEITAAQADAAGLLVPYVSLQLANVPPALVDELSADHTVTPYEYGYLAIDYNTSFGTSTGGAIAASAFPNFTQNSSWARQLLVENPTTDITGEEFLLWEIAFYSEILHQPWQSWWQAVDPYLPPAAPDWGTAFDEFTSPPNNPGMVVSYSTDPAYAVANGAGGSYNSTVSSWNGSFYGWKTLYGIGIVRGTTHLTLAEEFIDWFLSGTVQNEIPTNEWEYPANDTIALPGEYIAAIPPASIVALNDGLPQSSIVANLSSWLNTWQQIENSYAPG